MNFFGIRKGSRDCDVGASGGDVDDLRYTAIDVEGVVIDTNLENSAPWNGMNVNTAFG